MALSLLLPSTIAPTAVLYRVALELVLAFRHEDNRPPRRRHFSTRNEGSTRVCGYGVREPETYVMDVISDAPSVPQNRPLTRPRAVIKLTIITTRYTAAVEVAKTRGVFGDKANLTPAISGIPACARACLGQPRGTQRVHNRGANEGILTGLMVETPIALNIEQLPMKMVVAL